MKRKEINARNLADLTYGLKAKVPEKANQLENIRSILGHNLHKKIQEAPSINVKLKDIEVDEITEKIKAYTQYINQDLPEDDHNILDASDKKLRVPIIDVQRGNSVLPFSIMETEGENRWNQKVSKSIGPYITESGEDIWFNLYYYHDKLTVRSVDTGVDSFLFTNAKRSAWSSAINGDKNVALQKGYVWINASMLDSSAPNNSYVGFLIDEGTFKVGNGISWSGDVLNFNGAFEGELTLKLQQPDPNEPNMTGCKKAQKVQLKYPEEITLKWSNGNLVSFNGEKGFYNGFGNELTFFDFTTPLQYSAPLQHVIVPCQVEPESWNGEDSKSKIFETEGKAKIEEAFWALPVVTVNNPVSLAEPKHNGGWGLKLDEGLIASWINMLPKDTVQMHNPFLLLYPDAIAVFSFKTSIRKGVNRLEQTFASWEISENEKHRVPINLSYDDFFPMIYYCHALEGATLLIQGDGSMELDRPVYANGAFMNGKDLKGFVIFQSKADQLSIVLLMTRMQSLKDGLKPLTLSNAYLMVSNAFLMVLTGELSSTHPNLINKGRLILISAIARWKPILPDPYVSNMEMQWRGSQFDNYSNYDGLASQPVQATSFVSMLYSQVEWMTPDASEVKFVGYLPGETSVNIKPKSEPEVIPVPRPEGDDGQTKPIKITEEQRRNKKRIDTLWRTLEGTLDGWKLLDVSTNMDLIGVSVASRMIGKDRKLTNDLKVEHSNPGIETGAGQIVSPFVINGVAVNTPLKYVHAFTVPQVQWEPVRTLPEDQNVSALGWFPENLASLTDGGATRVLGTSQQMLPIIPDVVTQQITDSFNTGNEVLAMTTLSFGLRSLMQLLPSNSATRNADGMEIIRPDFASKNMKGGIQLLLSAEDGNPKSDARSPGFEGFTVQTLNGRDLYSGDDLAISVLGSTSQPAASVESFFNNQFSVGKPTQFVPVTRFDLSGYGGSNFSDWDDPEAMASVGKVQFQIMVGRTSFEMIKVVSKIYPWGITVTRSVTIERRSNASVIRKDSGWQAADAGIFDYTSSGGVDPGYSFHPGSFRGCYNVGSIRPASENTIKWREGAADEVELAPIYFDADVRLEGQTDGDTPSKGILGFIQVKPQLTMLDDADFFKLMKDQGPIGGPIDTFVNVGNSGLKFRATRFEVEGVENGATNEYVAMVKGQPNLPSNGSWSVIKMAAPGNTSDSQEAVTTDSDQGTPLFVANSLNPPLNGEMNVSGPFGDYQFIDAPDFFAGSPRYDYGLLQNTGSQCFVFRRPTIHNGTNEIRSALKPAFADPFAMATSKGVFPPVENSIEFPNNSYKLIVDSDSGKLKLNQPANWTNLRTPLVVAQDGTDQISIDYDTASLSYNLGFDNWNVEMDEFYLWSSMMNISKLHGMQFNLRAADNVQAKMVDVQTLFNPEIQEALNFIPGMGAPNVIGDIPLGMTNAKHEIKIHTGFKEEIKLLATEVVKVKLYLFGSAGLNSTYDTSRGTWLASFGAGVGALLDARFKYGIYFIILGLEVEVKFSGDVGTTTGGFKSLEINAFVGVGVETTICGKGAYAYLAIGIVFIYEDDKAKLGGLVKIEAKIDLVVVKVEAFAELKGVIYKGDDPSTALVETDVALCDASGEVGVSVTLLFFSIKASYKYKSTSVL
ncbi:MAG: hypothetical protein Crog4KO_08600 [Crocinitomicaceae bacterium]